MPIKRNGRKPRGGGARLAIGLLVALSSGCSQFVDPNVPEPLRPLREPEYHSEYLLYRPSHYDRAYKWPLIVVCHDRYPDSANKRIRAWTQLAESHGFLVVAPQLQTTGRVFTPQSARFVELLRLDEVRILAAIRHVRAGHNISEDRIFIHGWSGGAAVALHTGLRNPELLRAISLSHPEFEEGSMGDTRGRLDRHQPVLVSYDLSDAVTGKHGRRCAEWLRSFGAHLIDDATCPASLAAGQAPVDFFHNTVRNVPWLHVCAAPGPTGAPLEVRLKLRGSYAPKRFRWRFGDGSTSIEARPLHTYPAPGAYDVTVTFPGPDDTELTRAITLRVPETTTSRPKPKRFKRAGR